MVSRLGGRKSFAGSLMKSIAYHFSLTNWIILINIIVFIAVFGGVAIYNGSSNPSLNNSNVTESVNVTDISPGDRFIVENVAFSWENLAEGRVWTLVSNMFMHGSFSHLFFNMFSLFFIGNFIERLIGRKRFLIFYLISGIFAAFFFGILAFLFGNSGIGSAIFSTASTPAVGASGAIFGLLGLLAVITPRGKVYLLGGPLIAIIIVFAIQGFVPSWLFSIINILATIYIFVSIFSIFSRGANKLAIPIKMPFWILPIVAIVPLVIMGLFISLPIGNTAHLGGLIAGLAFGWYLRMKYKKKIELLNRMLERGQRKR